MKEKTILQLERELAGVEKQILALDAKIKQITDEIKSSLIQAKQ